MSSRVAHSRFLNKVPVCKGDLFDRIVTSVWNLDRQTGLLTYGATIYRKGAPNDLWNKQEHRLRALERFSQAPIRISLKYIGFGTMEDLSNIAIDWYIAENLIFKFGTHDKTHDESTSTEDTQTDEQLIHGRSTIHQGFNVEYSRLAQTYENYEDYSNRCYRRCICQQKQEDTSRTFDSNGSHGQDVVYLLVGLTVSTAVSLAYWYLVGV